MNESDARNVLLVRAYETLPAAQLNGGWTEEDRAGATLAALQFEGAAANPGAFVALRARIAAERLCLRERGARLALAALSWRPWLVWALALLAFAAGLATDAIGPAQQINVLAPPLLAVLAWNLAVYAAIGLRAATHRAGAGARRLGPLARQIARAATGFAFARGSEPLAPPLAGFARDWSIASAPLTAARIARMMHTAAATFAAGALLGMYLRGFALEYRAGWESTFLDAATVHALLAVVLGPAAALGGIALPDEAALAAIRSTVSPGENAARWIHLYAITLALFVLAPRALMALGHFLVERRLEDRFPLSIEDVYFQAIARAHLGQAARIHIVPYGCHLSPQARLGLDALLARVFGAKTEVSVAPTVPFGGEDALDPAMVPGAALALVAALFPLTATPERENHGVFVDALAARMPPATPLVVLVDESAFRQRFDSSGSVGAARRNERRAAWQSLLAASARAAVFVDLERADSGDAQRALRAAIDRAAAGAAKD